MYATQNCYDILITEAIVLIRSQVELIFFFFLINSNTFHNELMNMKE